MNFFEILQQVSSNAWIYLGAFALVLSILVFVHEFGHYIVARWCGVKVEMFSVGFGLEIIGFNDKRGTRWKVSMIPLGGFVKLYGDVDPALASNSKKDKEMHEPHLARMNPEDRAVAFFAKPVYKRALIVFAGPAINYIFAIILISAIFMAVGQPVTPPSAAAVIGGSAAEKAGFQPHDLVVSIDGKSIDNFEDIRREMMIGLDTPKHFEIMRNGKQMSITATPQKIEMKDRFGFKHQSGLLGLISPRHAIDIKQITKIDGRVYKNENDVRAALKVKMGTQFKVETHSGTENDILIVDPLASFNKKINDAKDPEKDMLFVSDQAANTFAHYTPLVAIERALQETWNVTEGTLEALGQIITGTRSPTELGGVIRIGALAGDMAQQGVIAFILFMGLLSINLGLVNLFPIPMLDGGHLLFYSIEATIGRPIPERIQEYAFRCGLVFLVGLMVYANLNDIMQLIL